MANELPSIAIYTDGGCKPNPGPGGWGAVFVQGGKVVRELRGGDPKTTNNRMELCAAIEALEALSGAHAVVVHTDSRYVENGITRWLAGWRRKGWVTSDRTPVQNRDLWERLDAATTRHRVRWEWVRGHAGHRHNEHADRLATKGRGDLARTGRQPDAVGAEAVHLHAAAAYSARTDEGGYGAVLRFGAVQRIVAGRVAGTSANRMHLVAVIEGLRALKRRMSVRVHTASGYVRDGATCWIEGWRARDWKTTEGKPVEHRDLWEELDALQADHDVEWSDPEGAISSEMEAAKRAARGVPAGPAGSV